MTKIELSKEQRKMAVLEITFTIKPLVICKSI